jgi:hypothetical protein
VIFRRCAGTRLAGSPQASIDIDANRLVLLDRLDNGDSDDTPDDDIAFRESAREAARKYRLPLLLLG